MKYLIDILSFAISSIIVCGIFAFLRQPKATEKGKVHFPKFFVIFGAVASSIFLITAIITSLSGEDAWISFGFLVFSSLGTILIIAFINCRISYDEDGFVAKTFFGIKRKVSYHQVTAIKENIHETLIYVSKRKVIVDEFSIGGTDFINFIKKKYRILHNGQNLPRIEPAKNDIFNGHIKETTGLYFAYGVVSAIIIGLLLFLICEACIPKNKKNTIEQTVTIESCNIEENGVILNSTRGDIYKIQHPADQINIHEIESICNGESKITIYSREVTSDDEESFYLVKAIMYNDHYLLSFTEESKLYMQKFLPLIALDSILLLLWVAYIFASIIVGRNPKKFSKSIVNFFFKEEYVIY